MDTINVKSRSPRIDLPALIPIGVLIALAGALYVRALEWWYYEWTANGSFYAHGVFIPFFVAVMVWRDREKLRRLPVERSLWGLALIIPAIALVLFAYRADVTLTLSISFILFLIGSTLLVAGKAITRCLLFPMLFLFTMIPVVPNGVINTVAFPIQLTSAKLASTMLNLVGFANIRYGTQIQMESYALNVELPCSGFKTLIGLLSFSAAFAYLVEGPVRKRWILFLTSAPLAILVNGARIALIGLVGEVFSTGAARSFHDWSGFIVLIFGFMFLFSFAKLLKLERFLGVPLQDEAPDASATTHEGGDEPTDPRAAESARLDAQYGPPRAGTLRQLAVGLYPVIGIVALTFLASRGVTRPKATFAVLQPSDVPRVLQAGEWAQVGDDQKIAKDVEETLNPATWTDRLYIAKAPHTGAINLLISGGNNRRTFHDPHECFMGSGYQLTDEGVTTIDTPIGPVGVMQTIAENSQTHSKSLLMFLYVVEGKQLQTTARVHTTMMWQSIFGESGRPSYFLRFRQMRDGIGEDRRRELKDFIRDVWTSVGPRVADFRATQVAGRQ